MSRASVSAIQLLPHPARPGRLPGIVQLSLPAAQRGVQFWYVSHQSDHYVPDLTTVTRADLSEFAALRHAPALRRSLETRAALRRALSAEVSGLVKPDDWVFDRPPSGKPLISQGFPQLHFSCSHVEALSLIVVSTSRPVGVDIAPAAVPTDASFLESHFTAQERQRLSRIQCAAERSGVAAQLWALKEAYAKLTGIGIAELRTADQSELSFDSQHVCDLVFHSWQIDHEGDRFSIGLAC